MEMDYRGSWANDKCKRMMRLSFSRELFIANTTLSNNLNSFTEEERGPLSQPRLSTANLGPTSSTAGTCIRRITYIAHDKALVPSIRTPTYDLSFYCL